MTWNPERYLTFAELRTRPAADLIARIPADSRQHIVDLGCGPGNATKLLRARWPAAKITGIDSSREMLTRAALEVPTIHWEQATIEGWQPRHRVDLIFSNAALHWVGGHEQLFVRLLGYLELGGVLAIQMPRNTAAPSHTALTETVRGGPWAAHLSPLLRPEPVSPSAWYFSALEPYVERIDIWETEYLQALTGDNPVAQWTQGTLLVPFLSALNHEERPAFEQAYRNRVRLAYPPQRNGVTLFPFRRLFIVAKR